jgi:hypothetical protein
MATPTNLTLNTELWHLSIDDLLGPMPETFRLGGPGPFVINLRSSSLAMTLPGADIQICQHGHVYQIQRREDDTVRYRLRLGPFASEEEADSQLAAVREIYPTALTARATPEDLRVLEALDKTSTTSAAAADLARPAPTPAALSDPNRAAAPVSPAPSAAVPEPARAAPAAPTPAAVAPSAPVMPVAPVPPIMPVARLAMPAQAPAPIKAPARMPSPAPASTARAAVPALDSTQTLRRLTPVELESEGGLRWYVIQLALSDAPVDPDTVPILDIFTLYRLYTVSGIEDGRVMHALRLGFFAEQIAASAVANYLGTYYEKPLIKRVSVAERERFSTEYVEARKDIGATGTHTAIEITSDLIVRQRRTTAS